LLQLPWQSPFSAREGATQFSVPDGRLVHLVPDLFRLDFSRTEWNVDLIRHAKSTSAQKTRKLLVLTIPVTASVIHRFANVYKRFADIEDAKQVIKSIAVMTMGALLIAPSSTFESWQLPFEAPHTLIRQYLQPTSDYSAGHRGVDFEVLQGEQILAPAAGIVSFAKTIVNREVISITHAGGFVSEFEPVCSDLAVGEAVAKGSLIGRVCEPESDYVRHCQAKPCVHFSLRLNGKYLSPLALIGGLNPSRLLPYARG
jgi:murein DD-endopeptidase MepM/ murein hydrolase activator NlpD